jgi:hypothetical protein
VLELRQSQIETLTELARIHEDPEEVSAHFKDANSMRTALEEGLSVEDCRKMTPTDVIAKWKKYVERMAPVLVEAELPAPSQACMTSLGQVRLMMFGRNCR